jgi:hypothetical protein
MLPCIEDLRITQINGKDRLALTPLDKLDEPPSLWRLKDQVDSLLPRVDLPDAILEIHALTGFADEFAHISEGRGRVEDLTLSICAVLVAEACNIGLEPLVRPEIPALTAARLAWVQLNYIRAETLIRANARLVKAQAHIPLTKAWGWRRGRISGWTPVRGSRAHPPCRFQQQIFPCETRGDLLQFH